jgi:hypothetical protein
MSRIAKTQVYDAFDWAAAQIADAGGRDKITSRAEIRRRVGELTGAERDLVDFFYRFIVRRGDAQGERVTRSDIEAAVAHARRHLVDAYDANDNGLSRDEIAAMPPLGRLAVIVARHRQSTGAELAASFEDLAQNLTFDDYGTEITTARFSGFHAPAELEQLTAQSFREALKLDPRDPKQAIGRTEPSAPFLTRLIGLHSPAQTGQALALTQALQSKLADLQVFILGRDPEGGPLHPVYIVGLAPDGSIAGLRSELVWT